MKEERKIWRLGAGLLVSMLLMAAAPVPAAAISFSGVVTDSSGAPVAAATVEMVGNPSIFTTSAGDGSFTLTGLPSGTTFSVKLSNTGFAPTYTANYNSTMDITSQMPFFLYTPAEMTSWGINPGKGVIRSRVSDNTFDSLAGAVITAASVIHPGTPYRVVYTDLQGKMGSSSTYANGLFTVLNLDAGDNVTITATKTGWTFNSRTFVAHADGVSQGRLIGTSVAPANFPIGATAVREMAIGKVAAFDGTNYLVGIQGFGTDNSIPAAQFVSPTGTLVGERISLGWWGGTPQVEFDGTNHLLAFDGCAIDNPCQGFPYVINGRFVSKSGVAIGLPFQISQSPGTVAWGGARNIAFDGTNYFVVWNAGPALNGCADQYGQFVSPSGTLLGPSIKINSTPCGGGGVALGFDGTNLLAVWMSEWDTMTTRSLCFSDNSCDVANIWGQFISKSSAGTPGALSGANFRIVGPSLPVHLPSLSFDGTNYLLAYPLATSPDQCKLGGCEFHLYGQFVSRTGTSVGSPITFSNAPGNQFLAASTFDGANYLITWTHGMGTPNTTVAAKGRYMDPAGNFISPPFTVFSTTTDGRIPWFIGIGGVNNGRFFVHVNWGTPGTDPFDFDAYANADVYGGFLSVSARKIRWDFDGDRKTDIAVYRPSTGVWYILQSSDGYDQAKYKAYLWGNATDVPVPGDYDGDGKTDIAVYRPSTGVWYILQSSDGYDQSKYKAYLWGDAASGDVPVPGDYDGDGKSDLAVRRPSTGVWYLLLSSTGYDPNLYQAYLWGESTDTSVPGDFDGDGKADIAVYRPSSGVWYLLQSTDGYDQSKYKAYLWGDAVSGYKPVPGDYDGDGKTDLAVRRPSTGVWYLLLSSTGYNPSQYQAYLWGNSTDTPVPGDFDGDGKMDITVYRPSTGVWYILHSSDGYDQSKYKAYLWGGPDDKPVSSFE